jgi:hypothetical protein
MAVLMMLEVEGGTAEQYDRIDELLGGVSADNAPEGLISHTAGITDTGLFVADVWESREDIDRFFEAQLGAALQSAGVQPAPPRILPIHNHLHGSGSGGESAVIAIIEGDGMTTADYDAVAADMDVFAGGGGGHPAVSHAVAVGDNGLVVVDVWGSEQEFGRFGEEQLAPRMGDRMAEMTPRFAKLHKRVVVKEPAQR